MHTRTSESLLVDWCHWILKMDLTIIRLVVVDLIENGLDYQMDDWCN